MCCNSPGKLGSWLYNAWNFTNYIAAFYWAILPIINTFLFARVPILELKGDKEHSFKLQSLKNQKSFYLFLFLMFSAGASGVQSGLQLGFLVTAIIPFVMFFSLFFILIRDKKSHIRPIGVNK